MNRTTLARRYAPLLAVVAVQLLIIAVVPSKAPDASSVAAGAQTGADGSLVAGEPGGAYVGAVGVTDGGDTAGSGAAAGAGGSSPGSAGGGGAGGGGGGSGGSGGTGGAGGGAAGPTGDISHCKSGRQFDPAIDPSAPPCVGKFTGKNPGKTYQGVSESEVKILYYRGKGSDAVDTILKAQGAFVDVPTQVAFFTVMAEFINKHYETYGRTVKIEVFEGKCNTIPPDYRCLRNEARQVVAEKQPFMVFDHTSLHSPFFAELSATKTINLGGWHFRDQFNKAWAPYHYDVWMSGTQLAQAFGQFYCAQLHGKKAIYAGDEAIKQRTRVLGVISTNDPENKKTVDDLKAELSKCGASVAHEYYYAQDISTADQQRRAGVAKMREAPESTTVLCMCDLVAPAFLYQTQEEQRYYPENAVAGTGFMDADKAARSYDTLLPSDPTCRCNHQFENAFGLSAIGAQENYEKGEDLAGRIYKALGKGNKAPFDAATAYAEYTSLIGTMIQQAGPNLNPQTVAAGLAKTPALAVKSPHREGRSIRPAEGDFTWIDDMRMVYWSPTRPSSFDGKPGSYVDLFPGQRFKVGDFKPADLVLPPKGAKGRE